ncbi:MAG: Flp pilus assembly protein CpaB [Alphaproteobacteria bacterium]|nr:Flp pilus assembly protein CpaB [Alphaproteobacteria bacterium]MBP7759589.1 Flp pilus assembly protein CpaB [Alphaproteobacteria bacterium]MBP7763128.1 Flp pilus assembly protein CpaB [Alphaproteobacteria bacterium]MBP7904587.1 Flp pilus assembly protein CpaB [Alphaproteobacteria bacterium]
MNRNILIVLGGAVLAAVLVAMLVQVSLGGKKGGGGKEVVEVLVASSDLKIGQELADGDLRWQEWPKDGVFRGAIVREGEQEAVEALEGRLRRDVAKDEAVLKSFLLKEKSGNFVANSLEPGMRAMAIKVEAKTMVGGFIKPGDYVDVVLSYKQTLKADKNDGPMFQMLVTMNISKWATETILQNVKVLAIDQTAEEDDDKDEAELGKTVTLQINAEQAEKLALGAEFGKVTLALRGVGDDTIVKKSWPTISDARLTHIDDEVFVAYQQLKMQTGVQRNIVRIYNGSSAK